MGYGNVQQVVFTLTARCRDCYRCLRVCPVKAIRMKNGQAYVDDTRCIACGTCIRECPQGAKSFRQDIEIVQRLVESDRFVCGERCAVLRGRLYRLAAQQAPVGPPCPRFRLHWPNHAGGLSGLGPHVTAYGRTGPYVHRHSLSGGGQLHREIPARRGRQPHPPLPLP